MIPGKARNKRLGTGGRIGVTPLDCRGEVIESISPVDGKPLGRVRQADAAAYDRVVRSAGGGLPAVARSSGAAAGRGGPKDRGGFPRAQKRARRSHSDRDGENIGQGEGEVQELIDMCDFAVGQSRMLYGYSMHSERDGHRMFEQYHPLGPAGVITAFNFPVAVWSWNAMLALIAGDAVVWKPSSKVPLCAIAANEIASRVIAGSGFPPGLLDLVIGPGEDIGRLMAEDGRLPLVSATGSVEMGRRVGSAVLSRLGRPLLELGGNNASSSPRAQIWTSFCGQYFLAPSGPRGRGARP